MQEIVNQSTHLVNLYFPHLFFFQMLFSSLIVVSAITFIPLPNPAAFAYVTEPKVSLADEDD